MRLLKLYFKYLRDGMRSFLSRFIPKDKPIYNSEEILSLQSIAPHTFNTDDIVQGKDGRIGKVILVMSDAKTDQQKAATIRWNTEKDGRTLDLLVPLADVKKI